MPALRIVLLLAGVGGAIARPFRLPAWAVPAACVVIGLAVGASTGHAVASALRPLAAPIGFLLAAVPLAVLLDRLGFFSTLADRLVRSGRGSGGLWVLAAVVTTLLNLDAAVVLLTPLYVRIARQTGRDPLALAFQPVLLACLASTALPVSNLTNLIAASWTSAHAIGFVSHLALPSAVATTVGWWRYRAVVAPDERTEALGAPRGDEPVTDARPDALRLGGMIVAVVLVGFVVGPSVGVEPWVVALAADVVLLAIMRTVPWRDVPVGTALVAAALAALAASAVASLGVGHLVGGRGVASLAGTVGAAAAAANLVNNLPTLLVALPALGHQPSPSLWAVLVGVDMGPVVLVTGSLASLLWLDALGRLGVPVRPGDFTRVGVRVGLPAAAAGAATFLLLSSVAR